VTTTLYRLSLTAYFALIALVVAWEGWLAPAPGLPPGLWLTLKAVPLLLPLHGMLRARPRAFIWAELVMLPYFIEGVVIAWTERATHVRIDTPLPYAWIEIGITLAFIAASAVYVRRRGGRDALVH
jgi:uncharacterized membrane protein